MNKKIISMILIFSLLAVGLTSIIAANETTGYVSTDENSDVEPITTSQEETQNDSTNENNENQTNSTSEGEGGDVVVPSNPDDLKKFNIIMNFVTPEGKSYFADKLAEVDNESFKDIISSLKNNDVSKILEQLGQLDQDKIDLFFATFLDIYDDTTQSNSNNNIKNNANSNSIIDIMTGSNSKNTLTNKLLSNNQKISSNQNNPSQNNPMYKYNNKYYSLVDFVSTLIKDFQNGVINYDQFISILEDNGIDTSDIKYENGVIEWGLLYIIGPTDGTETTIGNNSNIPIEDGNDGEAANSSYEQKNTEESSSQEVTNDAVAVNWTAK